MRDSLYGFIEGALELECDAFSDALAILAAHQGYRGYLVSDTARHHLLPAHRKVSPPSFSNGILSTRGKEIILKEMKEEGGEELPFY